MASRTWNDAMTSSDPAVRRFAASCRYTPADVLVRLARDSDNGVRSAVAYNPAAPREVVARLAVDPDTHVATAAASNPSIPITVLRDVLADDSDHDRHDEIWSAAARNPGAPVDLLRDLAAGGTISVRSSVAVNRASTPDLLEWLLATTLAEDDDWASEVVQSLAKNPKTPPASLARLAGRAGYEWLTPPTYSVQGLHALGDAPGVDLSATSPDTIRAFVQQCPDSRWRILSAIAASTATPADVLTALAIRGPKEVRTALAERDAVPVEVLRLVVDNSVGDLQSGLLLSLLARNPRTPLDLLARWARQPRTDLSLAGDLASNPAVPQTLVLQALSNYNPRPAPQPTPTFGSTSGSVIPPRPVTQPAPAPSLTRGAPAARSSAPTSRGAGRDPREMQQHGMEVFKQGCALSFGILVLIPFILLLLLILASLVLGGFSK